MMARTTSALCPSVDAAPFLKWAGGKRRLVTEYCRHLPERYGKYVEPFLGGGALYFALRPSAALLNDSNEELIHCYGAVRDNVESVLRCLRRHKCNATHFYAVRDTAPSNLSPQARAARTIFLNRTGFNGLYRVNRAGRFNVPFGGYGPDHDFVRAEETRAAARALHPANLTSGDFERVLHLAEPGDLVYFDPPYARAEESNSFTGYTKTGFDWTDQERLASAFSALAARGVSVLLSNADTPSVRRLYRKFQLRALTAARKISGTTRGRDAAREVLIWSHAPRTSVRVTSHCL